MTSPAPARFSPPRDRFGSMLRPVLLLFVFSILLLEFPGARERLVTPYSGLQTRNLQVQTVDPNGPNAAGGIRPGDEILAVDGVRVRNRAHYGRLVASNRAFATHDYTLRRGGLVVHAAVHYTRAPRGLIGERAGLLVLALSFLGLGVWVYLRRQDTLGFLFAMNTSMLAYFLTDRPAPSGWALQLAGEIAGDAIVLLFPAVLLHFFLRFPDRAGRESRPRRTLALYVPAVALACWSGLLATRRFLFDARHPAAEVALLAASSAYFALYILGSFAVFIRSYRSASRAHRQKLRVVIAATVAGLAPFLAVTVFSAIRPGSHPHATVVAELCLAFVPFGFAYAIVKHGAIELNTVVRKSLVYALLTGMLLAGYYVLIHLAGTFLSRELDLSQWVWMPAAVLLLAIIFAPVRARLQSIVDRVFYRTEFTYKLEVSDFSRRVARATTHAEVIDHFLERCEALLHPSFAAVYLRGDEKQLVLERSVDRPARAFPAEFAPDCFLGRYFTRYRTPLLTEFLERSWEKPRLDPASSALLALPGLAVCLPIAAPDRLLGVALLGQKRSGLVYGRADGELLETFAEQLALVIENTDLIQSMVEKERLKSEVMLAREIQQALLPSSPPRLPGIDLHGQMVSSTEVGGDYFDYFALDDERVVIAIGDVSGKGIPAAMLMASLQAVFKNRALKGGLAPAALNQELNDYLIEHAKPGQFATFFCGVLDLVRSTLTFSSAGQCPALLATGAFIDRLGNGGMVLGASRLHRFEEGTVAFRPGDMLFLYTDGVTEQANETGEQFGEERLVAFLRANRNLPPLALQNALLDTLAAFGAGRQDDDLTSVIALRKTA